MGGARKHDRIEINTKQEISHQGWLGLFVSYLASRSGSDCLNVTDEVCFGSDKMSQCLC